MKNVKLTFVLLVIGIAFTSCKDEKQETAQKSLDAYSKYVDSVSNITKEEATENWDAIENDYSRLKTDAETSLANATDKAKLETNLNNSEAKYEEFKNNILAEKEATDADDPKTVKYRILFGSGYVNDDMKFNWVNKDNILSVYENFVNTVEKNKDSYSREDWDEIKLVYEALDTRKNTVENEGLTSHDNNKIAGLKLKFSPMYTLNRMGAKSDENSQAKK
ncbi:DUF6565 domain-containing protein [Flavobacterium granuli]|uniref:RND superfamily exporter protein n=1 Tax=Flavobacterium granuli TaxID=280093 RepID=A0ABU1RY99_9FLAO|nr:DUF6565 domain-containing protein [Flavobacterium granuli]MDR6843730.1 putative RND superfamily exporter protein [Flavobacterium granuli]